MKTHSLRFTILMTLASLVPGAALRAACVPLSGAVARDDARRIAAVAPEASRDKAALPGGFSRAALAPPDASMLLDIEGAAHIRRELADRPVARWITGMSARGDAGRIWSGLAGQARMSEGRLFDLCFGRRATLIVRASAPDASQWAIVTEIQADTASRLLRRLRATALGPRAGGSGWELPEHDLLLIQRDAVMLIGSRSQPELLNEVAARLAGKVDISLAQADALAQANRLPAGQAAVYVRHDPPLGGWSLLSAHLEGDQLAVRQVSRFDAAPFTRNLTEFELDLAVLDAFEERSLLAIIEPTDTGRSQFETYAVAALGEGLVSPAMRRNMGERRLLVVGEVEGRAEPDPFDLQAPTLALCMELLDVSIAEAQLDRQMLALVTRINETGEGRFSINMPDTDAFVPDAPRRVDLSPAGRWMTGGLPLARPVSLTWRIARGDGAAWYVIATHPQQLDETVHVLQGVDRGHARLRPAGDRDGRPVSAQRHVHHCGVANGARISHHLRSWSDGAEALTQEGDAAAELRQAIELLSELAAGVDRAGWRVRRPSRLEMELEIDLTLSPPESSRQTPVKE